MISSTKGIAIRSTKFSETSLVVKVYTRDFGMQGYMVPGVRSPKSRIKPSLFQPLTLLDMVVYHRRHRDLNKIREVRIDTPLTTIPFLIEKTSIAMFASEVMFKTIREEESNESLFDFLSGAVRLLDHWEGKLTNFPLAFLIKLSRYLGFYPSDHQGREMEYFDLQKGFFTGIINNEEETISLPESRYLYQLLNQPIKDFDQIAIPGRSRRILMEKMLRFYRWHVTGLKKINSYPVLKEVLG